jgi:hypothetical protein
VSDENRRETCFYCKPDVRLDLVFSEPVKLHDLSAQIRFEARLHDDVTIDTAATYTALAKDCLRSNSADGMRIAFVLPPDVLALATARKYYIYLAPGAIADLSNNSFAGIGCGVSPGDGCEDPIGFMVRSEGVLQTWISGSAEGVAHPYSAVQLLFPEEVELDATAAAAITYEYVMPADPDTVVELSTAHLADQSAVAKNVFRLGTDPAQALHSDAKSRFLIAAADMFPDGSQVKMTVARGTFYFVDAFSISFSVNAGNATQPRVIAYQLLNTGEDVLDAGQEPRSLLLGLSANLEIRVFYDAFLMVSVGGEMTLSPHGFADKAARSMGTSTASDTDCFPSATEVNFSPCKMSVLDTSAAVDCAGTACSEVFSSAGSAAFNENGGGIDYGLTLTVPVGALIPGQEYSVALDADSYRIPTTLQLLFQQF